MAIFTEDLRTYMIAGKFTNVYAESFPAPTGTATANQIIGIISSSEIFDPGNPEIISFICRFVASGTAENSLRKAHEIVEFFWPRSQKPTWLQYTGFDTTNFIVKKVFCEKLPSLSRNSGNIFYSDCLLRFLTAT